MHHRKHCIVLLIVVLFSDSLRAQELLFRSGFEPGSEIVDQTSGGADIVGTDQSVAAPNDWAGLEDHPNIGKVNLQYQDKDDQQQSKRRAEIAADPTNSGRGQVLKYWLIDDHVTYERGRIQANMYGAEQGINELYERFKIYLPSESFLPLKEDSSSFGFLTILEIWNNNNWNPAFGDPDAYPYRVKVNITKPAGADQELYLNVGGEQQSRACCWGEGDDKQWEATSTYALPLDTWLDLEFYLLAGDATTGRVQMAVTAPGQEKQLLFDITSWTRHPDDPNPDGVKFFNPLKMYTNSESTIDKVSAAGDSLKLYWDDFELWKDKKIEGANGEGEGSSCRPSIQWENTAFDPPSNSFVVQWEVTPDGNYMDGVIGLSDGAAGAYSDLATIVRFNSEGKIDARDGDNYTADNAIPYERERTYQIRLEGDMTTRTYSAYVTPEGEAEQAIGTNFAFRTEQAEVAQLNHYAINTESCQLRASNFSVTSSEAERLSVRARGAAGSERLALWLDDQEATAWVLDTAFADYTYAGELAGKNIKVVFTNDDGSTRDIVVDYLQTNGVVLEAEDQPVNTGVWIPENNACGGEYDQVLHCNGYIDFGTPVNRLAANPSEAKRQLQAREVQPRLHPNPTRGTVYLSASDIAQVHIYNRLGQWMETHRVSDTAELDLRHLNPGMYLIRSGEGDQPYAQRIIIER